MLLGQFDIKVGEKGRVAFPKKFRQELGQRLIVTYGFETSLLVVSERNWKSLVGETEDKPFLLSSARDTKRFLLGGAVEVVLDSQGRMILPSYLREFAKIESEVVAVGLYNYVELWDKKHWNLHTQKVKGSISEIAETLIDKIQKND